MNYIGSKLSLLKFLCSTINDISGYKDGEHCFFADLFAGTGIVGLNYKLKGCTVLSNDIQYFSYVLNKHYIENSESLPQNLLSYFNNLQGIHGFIYNNYCAGSGSGRMYFNDENGMLCDAIRIALNKLRTAKKISTACYFYYLASLINSIDKYANTASVYGAFLKKLKKSAQKKFQLELLPIIQGEKGVVYNKDINSLICEIKGDILYLDPPYNARQYYTNYHILETISRYDNPQLRGATGLREDKSQHSNYCSRPQVAKTFENLIANAKFKYIFLSYNNEGLMSLDTIKNIMSKYGKYDVATQKYHRFKADTDNNRHILANETTEYIHCLTK